MRLLAKHNDMNVGNTNTVGLSEQLHVDKGTQFMPLMLTVGIKINERDAKQNMSAASMRYR
jgi:hypothetical protein